MVLLEIEERAKRELSLRIRLFVQMLTTAGYAGVGGALAAPMFESAPFGLANLFSLGFGLASLMVALYYVPEGERDVLS